MGQVKGGKHTKLFDLYSMGKYLDCAYKAEGMTTSKKYEDDPEPYLYLALCYIQISRDAELVKEYPDAIDNALQNGYTALKKDKNKYYWNNNKDIFDSLWYVGVSEARRYYGMGKFSKAISYIKKVQKIFPDDPSLYIFKAVCNIKNKNLSEASRDIEEFLKLVEGKQSNLDAMRKELLMEYYKEFIEHLTSSNLEDSAKSVKRKVGFFLGEGTSSQ